MSTTQQQSPLTQTPQQQAQQLLGEVQPVQHPELRAITLATLNGSATINGVSGFSSAPLDAEMITAVRAGSDLVLVTSATIKAESYVPVLLSSEAQIERKTRGQTPLPALGIVSRSLDFPSDSVVFEPSARGSLLVITENVDKQDAQRAHRYRRLTDAGIVVLMVSDLSTPAGLHSALTTLHKNGFSRISCEGGPSLYRKLLQTQLIDIIHLTIAPVIALPVETPSFGTDSSTDTALYHFAVEETLTATDGSVFLRLKATSGNKL
ncbi:pyrimidine reductase family protein [Corynebacterium silvaticum]|uniref:Pyrimidine reductase family protein n=1 Tax=Corynebacterium silvaticum TaxID=2320431 RepID=A0A7Y4LG58_9CORY|nr:pyrimidine reductase family protein [Corynebacterium silvaticum]ARU46278.1 pyrimidine reductase family protein [Corynebacterium silvaticum]MBH5299405.1 pyrimidine reductase family protein [Corynebacterium silvaticum]NOM64276.1 pyrimidine reductase family protein [Corynebacterium silvaticum]NON69484.1 pyrimidine reductase family protein [Corynebacterium silvaticum]TFA94113.1 pyrimidine reductase family protein [Corynebacterium silvaticum]